MKGPHVLSLMGSPSSAHRSRCSQEAVIDWSMCACSGGRDKWPFLGHVHVLALMGSSSSAWGGRGQQEVATDWDVIPVVGVPFSACRGRAVLWVKAAMVALLLV